MAKRDISNCNGEGRPEGGLSSPPFKENRGLENPRSLSFLNPYDEIEIHENRLPHWQQGDAFVFVTWRLADSLPSIKLDQWLEEKDAWLNRHPEPWDDKTKREYHEIFSRQIDDWLDQGSGSCVLKAPDISMIMADAFHHFDKARYELTSFVVMPNHVHVLFRPLGSNQLARIVKSWKGFTARKINRRLGRSGALWQEDYWDRLIRNEGHFARCLGYIQDNPVKAGLREGQFVLF